MCKKRLGGRKRQKEEEEKREEGALWEDCRVTTPILPTPTQPSERRAAEGHSKTSFLGHVESCLVVQTYRK